ncbi:pseudouridylate synthase [Rufibacter sp. DG15C]|nr:pseudouridylate synthase [Rufibacter sp. DG15C]
MPFKDIPVGLEVPGRFHSPFQKQPPAIAIAAARQVQEYLTTQTDWQHNFGLAPNQKGTVIGKMFGVLVVKTKQGQIGFLAAFSGKLASSNQHAYFVPPVYDSLTQGSFLNVGMQELTRLSQAIKTLQADSTKENLGEIELLMERRKNHSMALQEMLFDQYHFLNRSGEEKSLRYLFQKSSGKNPPAGAGECAAPKLLHYAFQNDLQPLALAEFWWGLSPKSAYWEHGHFYPSCQEKCAPILAHMLQGIELEEPSIF